MRAILSVAVCLLLQIFASSPAAAFKVDVHIWVAQQVMDDARDGAITVKLGDRTVRLPLPARVTAAIRDNPQAFLLGSIGPDALPDVIAGQMVIHPSVPGGWGTAEWIRHLYTDPNLNSAELAFTLGYMTHASADVFAHTYVNRYAGDLFELTNHEWAALRHINIESFISNYIPPIHELGGKKEIPASALVTGGGLTIPEDLLLRRLFFDADAMGQMRKSGSAPHLVAVYDLHKSLTDALAPGGKLEQIETMGLELVVSAQTGIPLAMLQLEEVQRLANKVNGEINDFAGDLSGYAQDLNTEFGKIEGLQLKVYEGGMKLAVDATAEVAKLHLELANAGVKLIALENEFASLPDKVKDKVCKSLGIDFLCKLVDVANPAKLAKEALIKETKKLIDRLKDEIPKAQRRAKEVIKQAVDVAEATLELRIQLTNQFIAFALNKPVGSQFRNHMERWRDSLPIVMSKYAKANAQAIVNSIDPAHPSILGPLADWLICYAPALASVPVEISETVCVVMDGIDRLKAEIDELEKALVDLVPPLKPIVELKEKLEAKVEELRQELYNLILTKSLEAFDKVADTNTLPFYKALTQPVGVSELNGVMSVDDSGQGLLLIPDTAERVLAELHVSDGRFSKEEFAPAYDAVVLSKLAMLDQDGLVRLAKAGGISQSLFGPYLYQRDGATAENILFGFVQSIDGNHQWQDLAPPHPRVNGYDVADYEERIKNVDAGYGYRDQTCPRDWGMRLWADPAAQRELFQKLFKGKIAFGVDNPSSLTPPFPAVLPSTYPNQVDGDWLIDDAAVLSAPATYVVAGTLDQRIVSANIQVNGATVDTVVPAAGQISYNLSTSESPFRVTVIGKSATGKELSRLHFIVGCAGSTGDGTLAGTVEVVKGDSLWRIAERITGNGADWPALFEANKELIKNPNLIYPGQVLTLPWPANVTVTKG